jgi:cholesterol transport system auxiliary component
MKVLLLLTSLLLFLGCSTTTSPITEYKISSSYSMTPQVNSTCKGKSIKIAQAFSPTPLMSTKMGYVLQNNKIHSYSQAIFSDTPNRAITSEILKDIRDSKLYKFVLNSKTRSNTDLILETNIEDFVQYYSDDLKSSYVIASINFTIIDLKTNSVIDSQTFKAKVTSTSQDAFGGAVALNKALSSVLFKNRTWMSEICK